MKNYHKEYETDKTGPDGGKDKRDFHYTGDYYLLPVTAKEIKKIFIKNLLFDILYILLIVLAGLSNNSGSRSMFIAAPYAFLYLPVVYMTFGAFASARMTERMERIAYDKAIGRMNRSCMGMMGISLYLCLADVLYLLLGEAKAGKGNEAVFLFACMLVFCGTALHRRYLQNLQKKVTICRRDKEVPIGK